MARLTSRLSYASVMATGAMFVALGGSGYAAIRLSANSVGSKQIKRGAVKNSDLGKNAVTTGKVKNGSLLSADFKSGQLSAGAAGPTGLQGPKGDTGAPGAPGADGSTLKASSVRTVVGPTATAPALTSSNVGAADGFASCSTGESLVGGGFVRGDFNQAFASVNTADPNTPGRWFVRILNYSSSPVDFQTTAICVKTG